MSTTRWPVMLPALLLASGLTACHRADTSRPLTSNASDGASAPVTPSVDVAPGNGLLPDFTQLVKAVGPAVVNVTTLQAVRPGGSVAGMDDPLLQFFRRFAPQGPGDGATTPRSRGLGSGFVIDAAGYILTNAHVVADADQVTVRLANSQRDYKAKVVGSDPQSDVALIKVDAQGLPVARLGDSDKLQIGEWVAAIGSPFGFANTITAGIVSAKERALPDESFVPFIQTDVAVNPGNSGGPLLNLRGEVVGINSQIYSRTGGYMGLSFAIPIDVAMDVAQQLRRDGHVTRGRLGVGIQEVTPELAQSFKLDPPRGALVSSIEPNGPAQKAGLAPGDVIVRFNGKDVASAGDLPRQVATAKPGSSVAIDVWRNGAVHTLTGRIGEAPTVVAGSGGDGDPASNSEGTGRSAGGGRLGLTLSELPPSARAALGVDYGLVVQEVSGPGSQSGLRRGDVVLGVDGQQLHNMADFRRRVESVKPGSSVALLVRRGDDQLYVPVTVVSS